MPHNVRRLLAALTVSGALALSSCVVADPAPPISLPPKAETRPVVPVSIDEETHFRDSHGRVVLLHGVNVVDKRPPYLPSVEEFGAADAALIRDLGFGVVRLGFTWSGLEPGRGLYDSAYLERLEEIVGQLAAFGILVLLDFHQDVMNERWGGEGFPDWAVDDGGIPIATGLPDWSLNVLQPSLWHAWDGFWANRDGIADSWVAAWEVVAIRLADQPNVLGYDLLNEPWPGSGFASPGIDKRVIQPLYERATDVIQSVDSDAIVFWEPDLATQLGRRSMLGSTSASNVALSFHVYCPFTLYGFFQATGAYSARACAEWSEDRLADAARERDEIGGGWLMTEFGATSLVADARLHARLADQAMVGWTWWNWKRLDDPTGEPDEALIPDDTGPLSLAPSTAALERIYPRATSGTPRSLRAEPGGTFEFDYEPDPSISAPSEIWLPSRLDPGDAGITIQGGSFTRSADRRVLMVAPAPGASTVRVVIEPPI